MAVAAEAKYSLKNCMGLICFRAAPGGAALLLYNDS